MVVYSFPNRLQVRGGGRVEGELYLPGDKSITHRAVLLGAISSGECVVANPAPGDDCVRSLTAVQTMGIETDRCKGYWIIRGRGLDGLQEPADVLDLGNSGTTARLLMGLLSGQPFVTVMTGDGSLRSRPMSRVIDPLSSMGARIWARDGGKRLPAAIQGGRLTGIRYRLPVPSAQVKSALLLAGLFADSVVEVEEPVPSRDHTERMLLAMGAEFKRRETVLYLKPGSPLSARRFEVPGDISSAGFFLVLASLLPDSRLELKRAGLNTTRTGILNVLDRMGADITCSSLHEEDWEPRGDIVVKTANLRGTIVEPHEVPRLIDEVPVLAVAAAFASGTTVFRGVEELRVKETNRLKAVVDELSRFGVKVFESGDDLVVEGGGPYKGCRCRTFGDHRMGMSLAVMGALSRGETSIDDTECIGTSFPGFSKEMNRVLTDGSSVREVS